jgi:hypothetical protein
VVKAMTIRQVVFFPWEKDQLALGTLNRYLLILKRFIFESSVRAGSPSFVAAPMGPRPDNNIPLVRFR